MDTVLRRLDLRDFKELYAENQTLHRSNSISPVSLQEGEKKKRRSSFQHNCLLPAVTTSFMLPTKQIQMITTNTPLRKSAFTAGFKHLLGFYSAEIIPASNPGITVRHHPVCGYRLHRQSLGEGAGCFPCWSEGGRGLRLSSASPSLVADMPACWGAWQTPLDPGAASPGSQYELGMCVQLLPLQSSSRQPATLFL